jgi:16S rRNA (uracil1498-N3)-methyltransferase
VSTRFYCPELAQNDIARLGSDEARHLSRVCRLGVGDIVEVFDGKGFATTARVAKVDKAGADLIAVGPPIAERPNPCAITLASAIPKGDRFDWLVEKATELGIDRLIPIITERSVVAPSESKLERLRKAIIEAAKQCRRNRLMILDPPATWKQLTSRFPRAIRVVADPNGIPWSQCPEIPRGSSVVLAVGPEGGFTTTERQDALLIGWREISLGFNILRVETAGVAACAGLLARVRAID